MRSHRSVSFLASVAALVLSCTADPSGAPKVDAKAGTKAAGAGADRAPPSEVAPAVRAAAPDLPSTYRLPPAEVVDIVDAPPTPRSFVSPERTRMLLAYYDHLPSIDWVAQPFERLAGIRVDTSRYAERRTRMYERLELVTLADAERAPVELPADIQMGTPSWSYDGTKLAFVRWESDALRLWVVDAATGKAKQLSDAKINTTIGPGFVWLPGGDEVLAFTVPPSTPAPPVRPIAPVGPSAEDTTKRKATNRTYQDLLEDPFDEALFEHMTTVQLAFVSLADGAVRPLGTPQMVIDVDASADSQHLLVTRIDKPFSYQVPYYRFPRKVEVWSRDAKVERTVAEQDLADEIPIGGVRTGPRRVGWHPQKPATLTWVEALDDGDPDSVVPHRDRLMQHEAPFAAVPTEIAKSEQRMVDVTWTSSEGQMLLSEYDRDRRWTTTWVRDESGGTPPRKLIDRSVRDAYADPGDPVMELRPDGTIVAISSGGSVYMSGAGASEKGNRPFLDRLQLSDGTTERLFESGSDEHAVFIDFASKDDFAELLVWRESKADVPNYYVVRDDARRAVTEFEDPHPQLTGIDKRILRYERRDGVKLSGTLYLPPGYKEGQRLPLVVWAYPVEYNDKDTAGQVRSSPNRFTRLQGSSPLMFLTQGYAVLSNAAMPIVGDPETMNDTFLTQISDSASAAIDAVVREGVADRGRVGVAGHSYGAFMTANLLAHSDLFAAGIARSGAYNRTLTPFGFQSERRTLWEAPQTYVDVSPLFAADKLDEPILLIHGEDDNNSGTYPLQSRRLFHALKGNGGTARLVMLPKESHGYAARESVLHVLAESFEWFDRHVKNAEPKPE